MLSDLFKLNIRDFARALLITVIGAFVGSIYGVVNGWVAAGTFPAWPVVWDAIKAGGGVALLAGISYLMKNFLTGKTDGILAK